MSEDDKGLDLTKAATDTEPTGPEIDTSTETETAEESATAGEPDQDVAIAGETTAATRNRRPLGPLWIAAIAVLVLATAGVTAWLYFSSFRPDQQTGPAARDSVLNAAKEGTVAVLSYTPETLDQDLSTARSHLTGDFLTYYSDFTDREVRPAVKAKHVTTTANVVRAAVSQMNPDQASVLVFVNQFITSADRTEPAMTASSVLVTMDKIDGNWLISSFDPV